MSASHPGPADSPKPRLAGSGMPPIGAEPRRSERVRFPGGNGFELAGILDLPAEISTGSPTIVFSHCFTCGKDLKAIARIGRGLAAQGISVLRYDMTGLGNSEGEFSRTHFSSNLADLRAAIAFAHTALGPVTGLLGHSFGGAASLAYAGMERDSSIAPRAVASLAAPSETHHLATLMARRNPDIETLGEGRVEIGGRSWLIRREMLADFRLHRLENLIAKIAVPLMVIHSPADKTVSFDHALRIMQFASAPRQAGEPPPVSLVALDGADHLLAEPPQDLGYVAGLLAAFFWRYRV